MKILKKISLFSLMLCLVLALTGCVKMEINWATANKKAIEIGLYDEDIVKHTDVLNKEFNRNGMSYISYNALFFKNIKTGEFLIDKLI